MKRRLLIIAVFLLAGAIVNVAVAWGCVLAYAGDGKRVDSWGAIEQMTDEGSEEWEYSLHDFDQVYYIWWLKRWGERGLEGVPTPARPAWSSPPLLQQEDRDLYEDWRFVEIASGWPCLSMKCQGACKKQWPGDPAAASFATGGIRLGEISWLRVPHVLPLWPLWPGFALNTPIYAAILWLLIRTPLALRGFIRRRRGRCPKCAYPVGDSTTCSECGNPLPKSRRGLTRSSCRAARRALETLNPSSRMLPGRAGRPGGELHR